MGTFGRLLWTLAAAALFSAPIAAANAQSNLPIVDTHVHYSQDAWGAYPPAAILKLFRDAGVRHALVSSTPDDGTLKLFGANSKVVVPMLRPYREGTDLSDWFRNQSVFDYVSKRIERNVYRGIGEFHLQGNAESKTKQMRGIVALAVKRNIHLHVHSDATPIRALFEIDPRVRVLWAHAGMSEPAKLVRAMLDEFPNLTTEISFRGGEILSGDDLDPDWRALMMRHQDRVMIGTDTFITQRWDTYGSLIDEHRAWLGKLPRAVAAKIAHKNAEREFKISIE